MAKNVLVVLDELEVGSPATFRNLSIFPVTGAEATKPPDYFLLDEAIERGALLISEISIAGSVPDLQVTNSDNVPVLIMDGEELVGAKQNRVLNLTVLIPAHATIRIPVSCVEAGRWAYESRSFLSAPHAQYAKGRATRAVHVTDSLRSTGGRRSNQIDVWADLEEKANRLGTRSTTGAMMAMYLDHAPQIEEYAQSFSATCRQYGVVFAINGSVQGIDLFDHPHTLRLALPKLIRGYALDAIDSRPAMLSDASSDEVTVFLRKIRQTDVIEIPALGIGTDLRFESSGIAGGALTADRKVIHLFAFRRDQDQENSELRVSRRMSRPSRRRHRSA